MQINLSNLHFLQERFWHMARNPTNAGYGLTRYREPKKTLVDHRSSLETSENNLVPSKLKHPCQFGFLR
jgi:hypothetical protein